MSSDDHHHGHAPRSLAARIWEREWLRKLGLEDVEWDAQHHCPLCSKPRRKVSGQPEVPQQAQETRRDAEQEGPPSGTRTAPARKKPRR